MILEILQMVVCTDIEDKEEADDPFIQSLKRLKGLSYRISDQDYKQLTGEAEVVMEVGKDIC